MLYDSFNDSESEESDSEDESEESERVIIFATQENLRSLDKCRTWYVDGTFDTAPSMFFQMFAILGTAVQVSNSGTLQQVALPFVYALLKSKNGTAYSKVFEVVVSKGRELGLAMQPQYVLSDFELAIINSAQNQLNTTVKCCFFHLMQTLYRKIGEK